MQVKRSERQSRSFSHCLVAATMPPLVCLLLGVFATGSTMWAQRSGNGRIVAPGACTVQQALQQEQRRDWHGAIDTYTCLSLAAPRDWRPINSMAGVYGILRRPKDELSWSQKAIALAPAQPEPCINYGNAQVALGNTAAAKASFQKAETVAPGSPLGPYSLAVLAEQTQHAAEAERGYRQALAIDPHFEDAAVSLAALLGNTGRVSEAIPLLKAVVAANPNAQDARQMLEAMQRTQRP